MSTEQQQDAEEHAKYRELAQDVARDDPEIPDIFSEAREQPAPQRQETPQAPPQPEPVYQQPQQSHQPQYQQPAQPQIPSAEDDPIGHFSHRLAAHEANLAQQQAGTAHDKFWDAVLTDEARARAELPDDYDPATEHLKAHRLAELAHQYPDNSREAQVVAYQHGFQSPAQLRQAILRNDAAQVAANAFRNGRPPSHDYYQLALERGYRPKQRLPNSIKRAMVDVADKGDDDTFDKMWKVFEREMKADEEEARRRSR